MCKKNKNKLVLYKSATVDGFGKSWDFSKTVLRHGVSVFTAVSDERKMRQRKKGGRQSSRETLFLLREPVRRRASENSSE